MALTGVTFNSNVGLGQPQTLRTGDNFRPSSIHAVKYRLSGNACQAEKRPCVIYPYNNYEMEIKTYGDRVRAARADLKMSQTALAKKAGVSQTTVSDIERGRNENSKDIIQLAKALKRSPEYLLLGKEREADNSDVMALWAALTQTEQDDIKSRAKRNLSKTEAELLADEFIWLFNNVPEMGRGLLRGALETVRRTCVKGERRKSKD